MPFSPPYAERAIDITVSLGGSGESGGGKVTLRGLRVTVEVESAVQTWSVAQIRIYGLKLDRINQLTKAGTNWVGADTNDVLVEAGTVGGKMTGLYEGQILQAYPDFNNQPEVSFLIHATGGRKVRMKPVSPNTFAGPVSAETVMSRMAEQAGFRLENNGVNVQLDNPYFPGTIGTQLQRAAKAANCFMYLDQLNKTVAIWPKTGNREGDVPVVSPDNGMIGYPEFDFNQVKIRTLFDPSIAIGLPFEVKSQLKAANGRWTATLASHLISAQLPDGPWETRATGTPAASVSAAASGTVGAGASA